MVHFQNYTAYEEIISNGCNEAFCGNICMNRVSNVSENWSTIFSPSSVIINHIYNYSLHVLAIIRGFIVITNSYTLYMSVILSFRLYYKDVYKLNCILKQIKR
jgi:hypothetical protein